MLCQARPSVSCNGTLCVKDGIWSTCREIGHTCCEAQGEDQWIARRYKSNERCCPGSGKLFNVKTEVCDQQHVRRRQPDEEMCGSNKAYNTTDSMCCIEDSGNAHANIGTVHPKGVGICCNGKYLQGEGLMCCNKQPYLRGKKLCCRLDASYHLLDMPSSGDGGCCGGKAYDGQTHVCIDHRVIPKAEQAKCNNISYNPETQICCGDRVYLKSEKLCYDSQPVSKENPDDNEVCEIWHDFRGTLRTFNNVINSDGSRSVCLDSIVNLTANQDICGRDSNPKVFDVTEDICCGGELFPGMKSSEFVCCESRAEIYDPARSTCCEDEISNEISDENGGRCCGGEAYDSKLYKCNDFDELENNCDSVLEEMKTIIQEKKFYLYKAKFVEILTQKGKKITWGLGSVEHIKVTKKLTLKKVKRAQVVTEIKKCYQEPTIGETYLVISNKKIKSRPNKKAKLFVLPLDTTFDTIISFDV